MFEVMPVRSPELQKELCETLGKTHADGTFAYYAAEMEDDLTTVKYPIAVLEFALSSEKAVIKTLGIREGSEKDEAVTVLVRAVMSWVNKAEVAQIEFDDGAADEELIRSFSFRRNDGGRWSVDLGKFYRSPCHYGKE